MISHFDVAKLSKQGYKVLVNETNVRLPGGEVVSNGTNFRDTCHLRRQAMIFVPCGGRPDAIDVSNVGSLIVDGKSKILYLVEGANLCVP